MRWTMALLLTMRRCVALRAPAPLYRRRCLTAMLDTTNEPLDAATVDWRGLRAEAAQLEELEPQGHPSTAFVDLPGGIGGASSVGPCGATTRQEDEPGEQLTVWEAGEAARNSKLLYERAADKRKAKRDGEKATVVALFKSTEWGRMLLSQKISKVPYFRCEYARSATAFSTKVLRRGMYGQTSALRVRCIPSIKVSPLSMLPPGRSIRPPCMSIAGSSCIHICWTLERVS